KALSGRDEAAAAAVTARRRVNCWSCMLCGTRMRGHGKTAASSSVMTARLRLGDQGRARQKRAPIELCFHDLDSFLFLLLNHSVNRISAGRPQHAAFRL